MKYIELTQNKKAMVDDEDFEWLSQWKWCYSLSRDGKRGYAVRSNYPSTTLIKMHRVIMGIVDPKIEVDHEDNNGVNNQHYNLRVSTHSQNNMNKKKPKNNTSGFKGVHLHKVSSSLAKPWRARIAVSTPEGRKDIHLGFFKTPEEAARAWNEAALKYHGKFARLNDV